MNLASADTKRWCQPDLLSVQKLKKNKSTIKIKAFGNVILVSENSKSKILHDLTKMNTRIRTDYIKR